MSLQDSLLSTAIANRDAWLEINEYCDGEEDFGAAGNFILKEISAYYERDPEATSIDRKVLLSKLKRKFNNEQQIDYVERVFDAARDISIANVMEEVINLKLDQTGNALAQMMVAGKHDRVDSLLEKYQRLREGVIAKDTDDYRIYQGFQIEGLLDEASLQADFPLLPKSLNDRLDGGVRRQDHIGVVARPNVGKSLFCINLASGMLTRGHRVLYIGNEDAQKKMRLRMVVRLSGLNKFEVAEHPQEAIAKAIVKGGENFTFVHAISGSPGWIGEMMKDTQADALFVDQLRNFEFKGATGLTQIIEEGAKQMRRIGIAHNALTVSVTQAGESAENKPVVRATDVEYSNTGFNAQLDLGIGIGMDKALHAMHQRMITIFKNKDAELEDSFVVKYDFLHQKVLSL